MAKLFNIKRYSHLNAYYIICRIKQTVYQRKNPDSPWLCSEAVAVIEQLLKKNDFVLEFGAGRSTKWFAQRCSYVYSIEHDFNWFNKVCKSIEGIDNIKIIYAKISKEKPAASDYLMAIDDIPVDKFSVILNDGKLRDLVFLASIDKLENGSIYILDNAKRYFPNRFNLLESIGNSFHNMDERWKIIYKSIENWRKIWFNDGVTSTLIMFKL